MANIAFPPNAGLESLDISLEWPGQSVFTALYTGDRHVYSRGVGLWVGQMTWASRGRADGAADIREIQVFLHQLEGAANTFDIPIPEDQSDRFTEGTSLLATAVQRTGSTMRVTCNRQSGLNAADYVTIDHQLFQLVSSLTAGVMVVSPYRPIDVTFTDSATPPNTGAVVEWANPYLRARKTDANSVSNLKNRDWAGPWTVSIVGV